MFFFSSSSGSPYSSLLKPHYQKIWLFTVLISDFNKEEYELPEDELKNGSKILEPFKCFNATILDQYIIIYS
jgi:hypothetical protein